MKSESFHALLIDRELGELSPEAVDLLEAWLAEHPESGAALPSIRRTLETASAAVRQFPELARPEPNVIELPAPRFRMIPFALAASVLVFLGATAWLGFRAGEASAQKAAAANNHEAVISPTANAVQHSGPWARYALVSGPRGELTVVRRDNPPQF